MPLQTRSHSLSPLFCKTQIGQGTHPQGGIQGVPLLINLEIPFKSFPLEYNIQSLVYISLSIFCWLFPISWIYLFIYVSNIVVYVYVAFYNSPWYIVCIPLVLGGMESTILPPRCSFPTLQLLHHIGEICSSCSKFLLVLLFSLTLQGPHKLPLTVLQDQTLYATHREHFSSFPTDVWLFMSRQGRSCDRSHNSCGGCRDRIHHNFPIPHDRELNYRVVVTKFLAPIFIKRGLPSGNHPFLPYDITPPLKVGVVKAQKEASLFYFLCIGTLFLQYF